MYPYDLIQSVGRALDILELVVNSEAGMSLHYVIARTHLKKTTAYNLQQTLVAKGFLVKRRNQIRYHLGPILLGMRRSQRDADLFNRARPILMHLANMFVGEAKLCESVGMRTVSMLIATPGRFGVMQPHTPPEMMPYGISIIFQAYWNKREIAEFDKKYNFNNPDNIWRPAKRSTDFWPVSESVEWR